MGSVQPIITLLGVIVISISVITPTTAQPPDKIYANHKPCRRHVGFSRCVESPLDVKDDDLWCPYHVCGPSFVKARKCGRKNKRATHYCKRASITVAMYECIRGKKHKIVRLPIGCKRKRGDCTGSTRACACKKVPADREVYIKVRPKKFRCPPRKRKISNGKR